MALYPSDKTETAYNGKDRNAGELGITPQMAKTAMPANLG